MQTPRSAFHSGHPTSVAIGLERLARGLQARSLLPILFLLLALPTVLIQVYLTPPIQVADEDNHFLRTVQIVEGHLFGRTLDGGNAGGVVDANAPVLAHGFDALKFRPGVKIDPGVYAAMDALRWRHGPAVSASFPNTAVYPFFLYLPATGGLALGRAAGLTMLDSLYLGRLATALVSAALASFALLICRQGRTLLFLILCFPMTLSLFASVSQDAMSIALGAVAAALWSDHVTRRAAMSPQARAVVALALGAVAAARIPLLPLYVLALMPTRPPEQGSRPRAADVVAAAAGLIPLAIGFYGAHAAKVPFRIADGVSAAGQLQWMVGHPVAALAVATATLQQDWFRHMHDMVGILGWLDVLFPDRFYRVITAGVSLAVLLDIIAPRPAFLPRWGWLPLAAVVVAVAGIFGALYLAWTPVGALLVDGVQGRYFLVPTIVLAVSAPGLGWSPGGRWAVCRDAAQAVLCGGFAALDLVVVPITLIHRYYG